VIRLGLSQSLSHARAAGRHAYAFTKSSKRSLVVADLYSVSLAAGSHHLLHHIADMVGGGASRDLTRHGVKDWSVMQCNAIQLAEI